MTEPTRCPKCLGKLPYQGGPIPTTTRECGNCDCYSCLIARLKADVSAALKIGEQRGREAGYRSGYDAALRVMMERFRSRNYGQTVVEIERFAEDVRAARQERPLNTTNPQQCGGDRA